jgi:hypothetical protein
MPEQNPNDQVAPDAEETENHTEEFGLMTFVKGGKAMSLAELQADTDGDEEALQEMGAIIREENETRLAQRQAQGTDE